MKNFFFFLGENTEKYITFSVTIEKEIIKIDKKWNEITNTISYRLQVIDRFIGRFMASSLSNLVYKLAERIHTIKCKYEQDDKNFETYGIKYRHSNCFLEYTSFKKDLIEKKCFFCNKDYQNKFDENLKKRSFNAYKFSNHDINKLILSLEKGVLPLWAYRWLGKIKLSIITWKKFLQSPKYGRYYWCRLHACKKNL